MATTTTSGRVREALSAADFPADKDQLVRCAEQAQADGDTIKALGAMPAETYDNLGEVLQSVPLDQGQDPAEEAAQRRTHDKPGLAQGEKDVEGHPIVDELGENRGS